MKTKLTLFLTALILAIPQLRADAFASEVGPSADPCLNHRFSSSDPRITLSPDYKADLSDQDDDFLELTANDSAARCSSGQWPRDGKPSILDFSVNRDYLTFDSFDSKSGSVSTTNVEFDLTLSGETCPGPGCSSPPVVPEPASILLFGTSLFVSARFLRKKFPK